MATLLGDSVDIADVALENHAEVPLLRLTMWSMCRTSLRSELENTVHVQCYVAPRIALPTGGLFAARPRAWDRVRERERERRDRRERERERERMHGSNKKRSTHTHTHTPDGVEHVPSSERRMTTRPHDARLTIETAERLTHADC